MRALGRLVLVFGIVTFLMIVGVVIPLRLHGAGGLADRRESGHIIAAVARPVSQLRRYRITPSYVKLTPDLPPYAENMHLCTPTTGQAEGFSDTLLSQSVTVYQPRQTHNYLDNFDPSFEAGEYWVTVDKDGCFYDRAHMAYEGQRSAWIMSDERNLSCYWRIHNQDIANLSLAAEHHYYFSGWIRTDSLENGAEAYISLRFWGPLDYSKKFSSTRVTTNTAESGGESEWVPVCGVAEVPSQANRARLECRLDGKGKVWCDDLFLGLDIAPVLTKTAYPEQINPGDWVTYIITYSNTGMEPAHVVKIREYLYTTNSDVQLVYATPEPDHSPCNDEWDIGTLTTTTRSIVVVVEVNSDTHKSCLINFATMESTNHVPGFDPVKLTLSVSTTVNITNTPGCAIDLRPPPNELVVTSPGETLLSHQVHNCGEITTNITVTVSPSLTWTVMPSTTLLHGLPPSQTGQVPVTLTIPSGVPSDTQGTVIWTATSSCGDSASITDVITIKVRPSVNYLPMVVRQYHIHPPDQCIDPIGNPCNSDGTDPYEPNDVYCSTRTFLDPDIPIQAPMCPGYPDDPDCPGDQNDYYYTYIWATGTLEIWLQNLPKIGEDYDLYLYHATCCNMENHDCENAVAQSNKPEQVNEYIIYPVPADQLGWYYVRVRPYLGNRSWEPYTLSVHFSPATGSE